MREFDRSDTDGIAVDDCRGRHGSISRSGLTPDLQRRAVLRSAFGLGIAAAASVFSLPAAADHLKIGQPAPPLVLHTLDGHDIATHDLPGQVIIATFWATWCEPCRDELPLLSDYAVRHAQDGL